MQLLRSIAALMLVVATGPAQDLPASDARRGQQLFETQQCVQCHRVNGRGGAVASDLARLVDRDYTPTVLVSLMWNHAPQMWSAMRQYGIPHEAMTPGKAADLFAYFEAARYFEKPGDAARGKQVWVAKHCSECHGITSSPNPDAPPVAKWESLADPIVLAQQMWNHGAQMRAEFGRKGLAWPRLTAGELTDLLVCLQHLPETRSWERAFQLPPADSGETLFRTKGCAGCHTGRLDLGVLLRNQTLTQIAADMWNHQPDMKPQPPSISQEEMRRILAYVWARQYFRGQGDAVRGRKVFQQKGCASCHSDPSSGATRLTRGKEGYSEITMIAVLWSHGPTMLERMEQKGVVWPRFTAPQMADIIAYLNSLP